MGAVRGEGSGRQIELTWIEEAIQSLNRAGIRAERGYPGKRLPELNQPQVAVNIHRWEPQTGTLTLRASVMSPASLGGGYCEDVAGLVCNVLCRLGGMCVQDGCENVSRTELLCIRVTAEFRQEEQVRFSVSVGNTPVADAVAFAAWRTKQETEATLQDATWQFRLETLGAEQALFPAETSTISVTQDGNQSQYSGCVVTSQRIEADADTLRCVWEGTAQNRVVSE